MPFGAAPTRASRSIAPRSTVTRSPRRDGADELLARRRHAGPAPIFPPVLLTSATSVIATPRVDGLHHVPDRERGDGHRDERLHLDARPVHGGHRGLDAEGVGALRLEPDGDVGEAERMAHRDQRGRLLRREDRGRAGALEHRPLRQVARQDARRAFPATCARGRARPRCASSPASRRCPPSSSGPRARRARARPSTASSARRSSTCGTSGGRSASRAS